MPDVEKHDMRRGRCAEETVLFCFSLSTNRTEKEDEPEVRRKYKTELRKTRT
jgi:hypothetical protein